jgi:hypothetical protein
MLENTQQDQCPASLAGDEATRFYMDVADGLHAMAQPLTVLHGVLGTLTLHGRTDPDHHHYLDLSTRQVDRLCGLLSSLRHLVDTRLFEAELSRIDLWETLVPVVEDHVAAHRGSGVVIRMAKPDHSVYVVGDAERTSQAFAAVLKVAVSISSPGDVIQVFPQLRGGFLELIAQNEAGHGKRLGSADRVSLSAAEAHIRSQQGRFECVEDPLRVLMALPLAEAVQGEAGDRSCQFTSEILRQAEIAVSPNFSSHKLFV